MRYFSPAGVVSAALSIAIYVIGISLLVWWSDTKLLSPLVSFPLAIFAHFIVEPILSKILHRPWLPRDNESSERK